MTDWRENLSSFFQDTGKDRDSQPDSEMSRFIRNIAIPAFEETAAELQKHGRKATIRDSGSSAGMTVEHNGEEELIYRIQGRTFPNGVLPYADIRFRERKGLKLISLERMLRSGSADYKISDITKEEVIQHFISNYTQRVQA